MANVRFLENRENSNSRQRGFEASFFQGTAGNGFGQLTGLRSIVPLSIPDQTRVPSTGERVPKESVVHLFPECLLSLLKRSHNACAFFFAQLNPVGDFISGAIAANALPHERVYSANALAWRIDGLGCRLRMILFRIRHT